jgi:hypothetical protein
MRICATIFTDCPTRANLLLRVKKISATVERWTLGTWRKAGGHCEMSEMNVRQAYSLLMALKNNLPGSITVDEQYVQQFDGILDALEKESGQNLDAFRVSGAELRHRMTSKNTLTSEVAYSEGPECRRPFLMMKIDAVLGFFTLQAERKSIGFSAH